MSNRNSFLFIQEIEQLQIYMVRKTQYDNEMIENAYNILKYSTKENPMKSKELQRKLRLDDADGRPNTRGLITEVIRRKRLPLAASSHGYYVIHNIDELKENNEQLDKRKIGIENRKVLINSVFLLEHPESLEDARFEEPEYFDEEDDDTG